MTTDSSNVDVGVDGAVSYAPVGSTAPTDADSPLDAAYDDVGYISSDGVNEARNRSTSNIVAWQKSDVTRTVVTEASISLGFTMIETNPVSLELFYGRPLDPVDGSVEIDPGETGGRRAVVLDYIDGDKYVRLFIPQAEVTEVGETNIAGGDAVGYEVTVMGYPDASLGYSAKKWFSALAVTP